MKKLPESEQEIMMIVWEYAEPVSRFQIEEKLNVEKNITPSTILTLLTRLEKKGFIQKVRNGKSNLYVPLVEKENYIVSAKYCYITHELRLHQNDRCKRFTPV